ncbi:diguanylate cyclase domain-containing protein [Actinoplanes sp. CA-054009]
MVWGLRSAIAAVIVVALGFQALLPSLSPATGRSVSDILIMLGSGSAGFLYLRRLRSETGRARAAVLLGALACLLWATANLAFLTNEIDPGLTAGNAGWMLSAAAAALLPVAMYLNGPPIRGAERYRNLIDVAAVSGAVYALTWQNAVEPALEAANSVLTPSLAEAFTLPEVVAAAIALVAMSRNLPTRAGRAPRLLGAASLVLAVGTLVSMRNGAEGLAWHSRGVGAAYLISVGLIVIAARLETPRDEPAGTRRLISGGWALLPYIPFVLAVVSCAGEQLRTGRLEPFLVWVLLSTFTLVVIRQFLTMAIVARQAISLEHLALHDPLTTLPNRAAFHKTGSQLVAAHPGAAVVMMLDLDGFKPVNDRCGHAAGDEVLRTIGSRLRQAVRPGDLVARLGGDEFVVVAVSGSREVAERVLRDVAEPMHVHGEWITVGGSIGLSSGTGDLDTQLREADQAMYAAKEAGKGAIRVYSPKTPAVVSSR